MSGFFPTGNGEDSALTIQLAKLNQTTGIKSGTLTSQPTATTIDVTPGTGTIANYSDPDDPMVTNVVFDGVTGYTPTNIGVDGTIFLGYNENSTTNIVEVGVITTLETKTNVLFAALVIVGGTIIFVQSQPFNLGYNSGSSFYDFLRDVIGPANSKGNEFGPTGANLQLSNTGGTIFVEGSNFLSDPRVPDENMIAAAPIVTFFKTRLDGAGGTISEVPPVTIVDPSLWDDNTGTLKVVSSNDWTVQVMFLGSSGSYTLTYGQQVFNTLAQAREALFDGTLLSVEGGSLPETVRRCFLIVRNNATDLSDPTQAEFINDGKFRLGGVTPSSGIPGITSPGGSDGNLQYNDMGTFNGTNDANWNNSTKLLSINGDITANTFNGAEIEHDSLVNLYVGNSIPIGITGERNNLFGILAASNISSGNDNTGVGGSVLESLTTGSRNLSLGGDSSFTLVSGNDNIVIGFNADVPTLNTSNFINIGGMIFGDSNSSKVRIGGSGALTALSPIEVVGDMIASGTGRSIYLNGVTNNGEDGLRLHQTASSGYIDLKGSGSLFLRVDDIEGNNPRFIISSSGDITETLGDSKVDGNLTVSAGAIFDTDTLVVDAINDRVGINVASPTVALDVNGAIEMQDPLTVLKLSNPTTAEEPSGGALKEAQIWFNATSKQYRGYNGTSIVTFTTT